LSTVTQRTPPSFCIECDAAEGECYHVGARYHEPWFELRNGGVLNPEYRDWFERNDHPRGAEQREGPKPRSLVAIRAELHPWVYLDDSLDSRLAAAYELNPSQVSLLSADLRRGLESGRIASPAGALANALKKIKPAT